MLYASKLVLKSQSDLTRSFPVDDDGGTLEPQKCPFLRTLYNHILNIIQAKLLLYLAQHPEELWLRRNFWVKIILYFELMTCLLFTQFFQFFINCFENHKLQQKGIVI